MNMTISRLSSALVKQTEQGFCGTSQNLICAILCPEIIAGKLLDCVKDIAQRSKDCRMHWFVHVDVHSMVNSANRGAAAAIMPYSSCHHQHVLQFSVFTLNLMLSSTRKITVHFFSSIEFKTLSSPQIWTSAQTYQVSVVWANALILLAATSASVLRDITPLWMVPGV